MLSMQCNTTVLKAKSSSIIDPAHFFSFLLGERERGHGRGGGTKRKRGNGGGQNRPNLSGPSSFAKWEPIRFSELILRR